MFIVLVNVYLVYFFILFLLFMHVVLIKHIDNLTTLVAQFCPEAAKKCLLGGVGSNFLIDILLGSTKFPQNSLKYFFPKK